MSDLLDAIRPLIRYKEPNHLSNALRRLTPALKRVGVLVIREDRSGEYRPFRIERVS
jgi:hypothetical protein